MGRAPWVEGFGHRIVKGEVRAAAQETWTLRTLDLGMLQAARASRASSRNPSEGISKR